MTIYLWKIPYDYPEKLIGRYERERSPDSFHFVQGTRLRQNQIFKHPILKFNVNKKQLEKYDCLINNTAIPLVNARLTNLLKKLADDDVQLFETIVECTDGELTGYKILNVTHTVKGIDHKRSDYAKMKQADAILRFKKLVYKPHCMMKHQLARDEEYKPHLLASQGIYDAFKRENITGVWLARPDEF